MKGGGFIKKIKKLSWDELQEKDNYIFENSFMKVYNKTMKYIINKTNLQTAMFYYVLYSHKNIKTGKCHPSIDTLSIESGISKRTVQVMLKNLRDCGIISYEIKNDGQCNQYYFPLENNNLKEN